MGFGMVAVPEPFLVRLLGEVAEGISHKFYSGRGVGNEDEVKMGRVGAEKAEGLEPYVVNHGTRVMGGLVGRVGVAVEICRELVGGPRDEGAGVDGCARVVEVNPFCL